MNNPRIEDIFARVPQEMGEFSAIEELVTPEKEMVVAQEAIQPVVSPVETAVMPEDIIKEVSLEVSSMIDEEGVVSSLKRLTTLISNIKLDSSDESGLGELARRRKEYCKGQATS